MKLPYLSSNEQQSLHSPPHCGASSLQERLSAGPGVVCQRLLHQGLAAGLLGQQSSHIWKHPAYEVCHRDEREPNVGEELPGVGGPLGRLAEPLQRGLEKRLLAVVLNLAVKKGSLRMLTVLLISARLLSRGENVSPGHWRGRS